MSERWRCFVAVPLAEPLRADLQAAMVGWRERPDLAGLRWVEARGMHLTLAFLGATDPAAVPRLVDRLGEVVARQEPTRLRTGGLGAFPSPRRARVAWYGVEGRPRLTALADELAEALDLDRSLPFHPHVTLARARRESVDLRGWLGESSAPEGELALDRLELLRSHLGPGPARYEVLWTRSLGADTP